jgi:hypothetical protein
MRVPSGIGCVDGLFGLVCGFFYFVFQNLFGVSFFSSFFKPPPVFTTDNCFMSGAPPEDGDAEGRAPKRGRLDADGYFAEMGKLCDAKLQSQKEAHEQELQALRDEMGKLCDAKLQSQKEAHEQEMRALRDEMILRIRHTDQLVLEKKGMGVAVAGAAIDHGDEVHFMFMYQGNHELVASTFEHTFLGPVLKGMLTVRLMCHLIGGPARFVSLLTLTQDVGNECVPYELRSLMRRGVVTYDYVAVESSDPYGEHNFLTMDTVETWALGPGKERILRYMRAWKQRGPFMWKKGEGPLFPFEQLHA